jgi:cytochrome bd ubiquinol oxidase subunit I
VDVLDLARWQFGITTVYHFLFVPLSIGLALLVASLQTAWVRTGRVAYLRATRFWGKLFLINFAMGVVTGIVQEFQFGMNWSDYSRFVGDVFGAPLAIEGLLAFFLEATFLGLWIFGWDRLPRRVHLASIWVVAAGTLLSAYFILAANSWMQHPVGFTYDPASGRAELTDFVAVLTNSTLLVAFPHTVAACLLTGAVVMVAGSAWHLARGRDRDVFRPSLRLGLVVTLLASVAVAVTGDLQGKIMTEQQPMKMAAAEALYRTAQPAPFSLFTVGTLDGSRPVFSVEVPRVLSFLATGSPNGRVEGIDDLQRQYQERFGAGDYRPNIPVTYWTFRLMVGLGLAMALVALVGLWLTRRGRLPADRRWWRAGMAAAALPFLANTAGWVFTEMGRQPWTVFGQLRTADSVSPGVGAGSVLTSLVVFTVLYGVLAVIELTLLLRYLRAGPPDVGDPEGGAAGGEPGGGAADRDDGQRPMAFAY